LQTLCTRFRPPLLNRLPAALFWKLKKRCERRAPLAFDIYAQHSGESAHVSGQAASDAIKAKLESAAPLMISRFGSVELDCLLNHLSVNSARPMRHAWEDFLAGKSRPFWWDHRVIRSMSNNAGFFPDTVPMVEEFSRRMLQDLPLIDVLGSWLNGESLLARDLAGATTVPLDDLNPFCHRDPWSEALKGRTVLVVHPFETSIRSQYAKREKLFADPRVLPDFELKTVVPPQSLARNRIGFRSWFEAFEALRDRVAATSFDVALVACGAYGLPLAAAIKGMGRQAIHLGGALQLMFGIKGRRWDGWEMLAPHVNEHWATPLDSERPPHHWRVEGGCYW
jgi:hypothetical protein